LRLRKEQGCALDKVSVIAGQNEVAELICRNDVTSRRRLNVD
jgi:hypothetical protein